MATAFQVPSVFSAIDKMTAPVRQMQKSVSTFASKSEASIARVDRVMNKLTPSIGSAGKQLLSFAGQAAIVAGVVATIKFGGDEARRYEANIQSLKAITGVAGDQFLEFKDQIFGVARAQKFAAADIAKTFEVIGSDIPTLLGNAEALGKVADASVTLKKTMGGDLEAATKSLTGSLNQLQLGADQSQRVIDAFAAGNIAGNVSVTELAEGTDKFGAVLKGMNGTIEEAVALQEVLGKANLKGAEAGTNLRNVLLAVSTASTLPPEALKSFKKFGVNTAILEDKTVSMSVKLKELSKIAQSESALKNIFGKQNLVAAATLLRNTETFDDILNSVSGNNALGKAAELAAIKTDTLNDVFQELKNTFSNVITGTSQTSFVLDGLKVVLRFIADNLGTIIGALIVYIGVILAVKTALLVLRAVQIAQSVILGIMTALQWKNTMALKGNIIAMQAHAIVTKAAGVAMKIFNLIMAANPIGLVVAAILLMIAAIVVVTQKWDEWGAAVSLLLGPLGTIISIIQSLRRNWDLIVSSFQNGGILNGIKAIGLALVDALLQPLEQAAKLIEKFTGLDLGINAITGARQSVQAGIETAAGAEVTGLVRTNQDTAGIAQVAEPINSEATIASSNTERIESVEQQNLKINIDDQGGNANIDDTETKGLDINLEQGFSFGS